MMRLPGLGVFALLGLSLWVGACAADPGNSPDVAGEQVVVDPSIACEAMCDVQDQCLGSDSGCVEVCLEAYDLFAKALVPGFLEETGLCVEQLDCGDMPVDETGDRDPIGYCFDRVSCAQPLSEEGKEIGTVVYDLFARCSDAEAAAGAVNPAEHTPMLACLNEEYRANLVHCMSVFECPEEPKEIRAILFGCLGDFGAFMLEISKPSYSVPQTLGGEDGASKEVPR